MLGLIAEQLQNLTTHVLHLGPWATFASLSFFTAALLGGDVLALRGALLMAYVFNLINGLTGVPTWPYIDWKGRLNVDMVCWAAAAGFLHGYAVVRMLMDELPVRFADEDDEQLARFFNRRSGMERLEAREVLKRGKWLRVSAGQRVVSSWQLHEHVYLLVEGRCTFTHAGASSAAAAAAAAAGTAAWLGEGGGGTITNAVHAEAQAAAVDGPDSNGKQARGAVPAAQSVRGWSESFTVLSGKIFLLSALNVFGVYIGFDDREHGNELEVWAETDCLLYCWPMSAMEEMATACSPSLAAYWRNFITYSLASELEYRSRRRMTGIFRCATGELEDESWLAGARSRDFTDPLRPYEEPPKPSWQRFSSWLWRALSPFPPPGLRHTALPTTGVMARTRAMAVAAERAHAREARIASSQWEGIALDPGMFLEEERAQRFRSGLLAPLLERLPLS